MDRDTRMNCDQASESIALAVYDDLPDDERHALEQHLLRCEACREELAAVDALRTAMTLHACEEPSANLLASARLKLDEALDAMPQGGWISRAGRRLRLDLLRLGGAPVMASALLVFGAVGGGYGGYCLGAHRLHQQQARMILKALPIQTATSNPALAVASAPAAGGPQSVPDDTLQIDPATAQIANVAEVLHAPDSREVEVRFNRLVPETIQGSIDDPDIRRLLLLGIESPQSSMVRDNSVNLLAQQCQSGSCSEGPVRHALMQALRYDSNPGVRLNALTGLEPYIAEDVHVRNAVLDAVLHDSDPMVRSRAIQLIAPIAADSSVRQVLRTVAVQDDDPLLRSVSQQVLDQASQVQ
jgi:hypothetical protein